MPVLGSTSGSGLLKRGVIIPEGSLDVWKAARNASASTRTEVVIFGDSTTFGSTGGSPFFYSWVQKLRANSIAAGYPDGGRGIAGLGDTAGMSGPENIPIIQSTSGGTWTSAGDSNDMLLSETPTTSTNGATIVFQGYGTKARLHYTKIGTGGTFTYAINGGSATTVNTNFAGFSGATIYLDLGGTDSTLHTVTVVNTSGARTSVVAEFLRSTGIVYHKQAISGISYGSYFSTDNSGNGNYQAQLALGLTPGTATSVNGLGWGSPIATRPNYRHPSLAICALSINDQQGASSIDTASVERGVELFIRMTRAAGADPLVVIPHLDYASGAHLYSGPIKRALLAVAMSHQCAVVDFNEALGPINSSGLQAGAPHLSQTASDREADFIWTQALAR